MDGSRRSSNDEPSFHSYSPRAVGFDIEVPSSELGPQRNIGEETRAKITQKEFRGGGLIASVARVCYGTFEQKKAMIVVFRLLLHCSRDLRQFQDLEVEASFEPQAKDRPFPIVFDLSPRKIHGVLNANEATWSYWIEKQCFKSKIANGTKSAVSNHVQLSSEPISKLTINGVPWSNSRRGVPHKACWYIKAEGKAGVGIPDEVNLAVAVGCEEALRAVVKITLNLPLYKRLAFPWSKDDPVLFPLKEPGSFIGETLKTTQFEKLSDADWANLISGSEVSSRIDSYLGFVRDSIETLRRT